MIPPITNNTGGFNLAQYFPFLITIAPLVLFFQQTKHFVLKILRIFWKERIVPRDFSYDFYKELCDKSFVINFDDYKLESYGYFSIKHAKYLPILFKMYNMEIFLYKRFIPIFIFGDIGGIRIQYIKYSFNFEKTLIKSINDTYQKTCREIEKKQHYDRFYIEMKRGLSLKHKLLSGESEKPSHNSISKDINSNSEKYTHSIFDANIFYVNKIPRTIGIDINNIAYSSSISTKNKYIFTKQGKYALSKVEKWLKAENWYQEKNIRWYRGMGLTGKPGTGKSTLVYEIAKKLGIPIFVFDLSTYCNDEFDRDINGLTNDSGIVLFEDIDSIFKGRENLHKTDQYGGLTFDCLINQLSGVKSIRNKFVFVTTNHIENLDAALKRDGRIDEIIEIESLNVEEKLKVATIILDNNKELIEIVMKNSEKLNTAEFENLCVSTALDSFWKS